MQERNQTSEINFRPVWLIDSIDWMIGGSHVINNESTRMKNEWLLMNVAEVAESIKLIYAVNSN